MPMLMSPVAAFQELFKLDRKVAFPLVAGLAVLASAVIVRSWGVEPGTMGLIALYVLGLGLLLVIVAAIVQWERLKLLLGLVLVLALLGVVALFGVSAVVRPPWLPPPWCLARFLIPCDLVEGDIRRRYGQEITAKADIPARIALPAAATVGTGRREDPADAHPAPAAVPAPGGGGAPAPVPTPQPPGPGPVPSTARVYIQFAGIITRDSVKALNAALRRGGWQVQGDSGDRLGVAAGLNEVRYGPSSDRRAAEALAQAVSATNLTSRPVATKQMASVAPNLELWISN